jgi:protease IV
MKQFFKFMFASMLGVFLSLFLIMLLTIGGIMAIVAASDSDKIKVDPNSVLHIKFEEELVDRGSKSPFDNFDFSTFTSSPKLGLKDVLESLDNAKEDNNIKGIFLDITSVSGGSAIVNEVRAKLEEFKESGKFIYAYSEMYTQSGYYLASVADKIFLNPQGALDWKGLGAQILFFKGALEKLELEPQIIRHGKFKSAVEPFMLDKMSDANREQTATYINSIWNDILEKVSSSRSIDMKELNRLSDELIIQKADDALEHKMVDQLAYKDEVLELIKEKTEVESTKKIKFVELAKYTKAPKAKKPELAKDKIAVIYAIGQIESGEGDKETIGSDRISKAISDARLDDKIKAIVLRVNSPGGSALASEVIWREMELAKKAKPVIVSMGNLAASGGYYISCNADTIVASPNTITGSIGVFGVLFNAQKFFNNKLGINIDTVKTGQHADLGAFYRPLTTNERAIIQNSVEYIYDVFLTRVAEGRGLTKEQVDEIGQGRVWSGADAKRLGLVDVLGGLEVAIEIAANKAGLEKYRLVNFPEEKDAFAKFMASFGAEAKASFMKNELGDGYKYYKQVQSLLNMRGVQARMEYDITLD